MPDVSYYHYLFFHLAIQRLSAIGVKLSLQS